MIILLILAVSTTCAMPAEVVSFDYGWRFFLGDPPTPASAPAPAPAPPPPGTCVDGVNATFPIPEPIELLGLIGNTKATTAAECGMACCMAGPVACWTWQ